MLVELPFFVLLGPDYAGKSTVMRALAADPSVRLLSVDDEFLAPEHEALSRLKSDLLRDTLPAMGKHYSADFVAGLLQTAVVHLRDQVLDCGPHVPVVVDSYYYKILAKCLLVGATAGPVFDWWRRFPQPRRVLFLDVDPGTAWSRSGEGARANRLEFHGEHVGREPFTRFQVDLRAAILAEVAHLPVEFLPGAGDVASTVRRVREVVAREFG
jgi:thymidylate kinase